MSTAESVHPPPLVVINPTRDWSCTKCSGTGGDLLIMEDAGPVCMKCAEMDHLVFLPSGDAGLTKTGNVPLLLTDPSPNTYQGITRVNAGSMQLSKPVGVDALLDACLLRQTR